MTDASTPVQYARQIAAYIADPSTIRVRTLDMFGRAPSREQCARYREEVEYERSRQVTPCGNRAPRQLDKATAKVRNEAIRREASKGLNGSQIAAKLGLNARTVRSYLRRSAAA